jgi:Mce-associated membrane protein
LHQQITSATAAEKRQILAGKTVTTAKVLDAAVVSFDTSAGSATVIASIELTKQPVGKTAQVQRERLRAALTRVGSTWKINSLGPVGVTLP